MKATLKKAIRDESGKVLILALIVLVVGGLILGPLLGLMSTGLASGRVYETKTAELYAADAGIEDAINWLVHGKPHAWPWSPGDEDGTWHRSRVLEINRNDVNVTVEALGSLDDHKYRITSTAIGEGNGTTVVSVVKAPPRHLGCHYFTEGLTLNNQSGTLSGTVIVLGDVEFENSYSMNATEVFIDGNLHLANHSKLNADIVCVSGDITLGQHTDLNADLHLLGDHCVITIDNANSFVNGNIWAMGDVTINILSGNNNRDEVQGHVYAPNGTVTVRFRDPNAVLRGDIYAGEPPIVIDKGGPQQNPHGLHAGCKYYFDDTHYWVSDDACGPQLDPPFIIGDCPQLPEPQGPVVLSYEVSGPGG